ncbi:MAG: BatD family protein [Bacteroidales bacterium]
MQKYKFKYLFLTVIFCFIIPLFSLVYAQEPVQFSARYPKQVAEGQEFEISFNLNTQGGSNFKSPSFRGFDLLYGPSQSQSSNIQIINGVASQSYNFSYSYVIKALKTGNYAIGKASINVNGKKYESENININVVKGNAGSNSNTQNNNRGRNSQSAPTQGDKEISSKDLFIRASANKTQVYQGEEIILSYKIYTAVSLSQYNIYKTPSIKGFWSEELKDMPQQEAKTEVINGKRYTVAELRRIAIYPQESGSLSIDPLEIEAIAQVPVQNQRQRTGSIFDFFDDPFFASVVNVKKNLKSNTLRIKVKPLPEKNKPASFTGLVGNYTCKFEYDKNKQIKANDAITFKFTVKGQGNIQLINQPELVFPPDFEVYEPKISTQINANANGLSGSKTFEFIVVPRNPGVYKINSFTYSFFNPQKADYLNQTIDEITLNIAPSEGNGTGNNLQTQSKLALLNNDIEYIAKNTHFSPKGNAFFLSFYFYLSLGLCFFCFIAYLFYNHKRLKQELDIVGTQNKKALKKAKKCLKKANQYLKQNAKDLFYIEISQALWGFLSQKLNISLAELSIDNVGKTLSEQNISEDLIQNFLVTLDHCEYERFAPQGNSQESMEHIYNEALDVIYKLVKELK